MVRTPTGSDTRMYSPRSESNLGWSKDEDESKYGYGDPEQMEIARDEKQSEEEKTTVTDDLPHLQISIPEPEPPMMPPMMPPMEEEEEEMMPSVANPMGADLSAMTGMPDTGNLSIGNAIGTMPAPGGMLATGEPMDMAWRLLKQANYRQAGGTLIRDSEGRVLLVRRNELLPDGSLKPGGSFHGMYELPGGNVDPGETAQEGVMRETLEETGLPLVNMSALEPNVYDESQKVYHGFTADIDPSHQGDVQLSDEHDKYMWLHPEEALAMQEHPDGMEMPRWLSQDAIKFFTQMSGQDVEKGITDLAWSSLMKARLDKVKGGEDKSWKQPQYETQPGGSDITTGTSRRAKLQSRFLQPHKKRGIDQAPLSVHRTHLGVETKQPLRMFPEKYGHQMATQARRKLMGNIPQVPAGHGVGAERSYSPKAPKSAPSGGLPLTEPRTPMERGKSFAKSIKEDVEEVKKKMDYLHFAQIRRLLRRLKDATERQERRLKSKDQSGPGEKGEAGHREAQNSTTRPEGATEDMENDPKNWGAPSTMFVGRGSGRIG